MRRATRTSSSENAPVDLREMPHDLEGHLEEQLRRMPRRSGAGDASDHALVELMAEQGAEHRADGTRHGQSQRCSDDFSDPLHLVTRETGHYPRPARPISVQACPATLSGVIIPLFRPARIR